jgi:hypothetical protein
MVMHPFHPFEIALMHRIDSYVPRPALRVRPSQWLPSPAASFGRRPSLPVSPARPQIIDMRRRCRRQPLVTCIAIVIEFSIENLLRGSPTNTWPGTSPPAACTCPGRSCPPSPTSSDHTPCIASAASAQAKSHHLRSADSENPPAIATRTAAPMPMKSPFALLNRCPGEFAAGVVDGACLGPEPPWSEILS